MPTTTVVCCHEFGDPLKVLRVEQWELRRPGPGEVLVQMLAAPINPADLNVIEGRYGKRPSLPAALGNEGVGEVLQLGPDVQTLAVGQWVRPEPGVGSWQQRLVVPAHRLTPLPDGLTLEQAATLCVNPATAWRMLHDFVALEPGDWVVQNAATSGVGRAVIQIARALGLNLVSVVRRPEAVEELVTAHGAEQTLLTEEADLPRQIAQLTGGPRPRLALNAVGGPSALNLARTLAPGGVHVTYGAMSRAPFTIPAALLIFNDLRFVGFWVTAWYERADPGQVDAMLQRLAALYADGTLTTHIEARYPLHQAREALAHVLRPGRRGKVLLTMEPNPGP